MRLLKRVLLLAVLVIGVGFAALWWFVLRDDAPPRAELRDRSSDTTVAAPDDTAAPDSTADPSFAGTWTVQPDDEVFVGYRVTELFAGETIKNTAVGRTPAVTGEITIADTSVQSATFTADLTQLSSDESRRDNRIKTSGIETDTFPEATFTLTAPIDLGSPEEGAEVNVTATGDLTLHGVTRSIEVPIDARWNGDTIDIAGGVPIVFADYDITAPQVPAFVTVDENGEMEFQLTFVPA
jgi:polyisoprenoid-binding protein YceI